MLTKILKMDKNTIHKEICKELGEIYKTKNIRYDDSFAKSYNEYGLTMPCIRIEDKLSRFKALSKNKDLDNQKDESLEDTLKDLANYAIMTLIEIQINNKK